MSATGKRRERRERRREWRGRRESQKRALEQMDSQGEWLLYLAREEGKIASQIASLDG